MTFLTELQRLKEAATKGPWKDSGGYICSASVKEARGRMEIYAPVAQCSQVSGRTNENKANAEIIVHLVNHADAIEALVMACDCAFIDSSRTRALNHILEARAALDAAGKEGA